MAAFGSRPEPERALASLRRVLRQMRTERVGMCRCAHVYICMSGCEKRPQLPFNAAQTPLILVLCLSLTGTQSEPRNHLPGSLTLFNICTDMQTQTDTCAHSVDDRHLPSTMPPQCIVFLFKSSLSKQACRELTNQVLFANLTWVITICGLGPWKQFIQISPRCASLLFLLFPNI